MRRKLRRRHRGKRIIEAVIDLVGDEADARALRRRHQAGERLAGHHRARRIGRASDQHALQRRLAMRRQQGFAGQRVTGLARGLDQHRLAAERGQDVAIRRIAGHRHRDAVARLEHREKGQDERARRSRRDHDPLGIHGAAISLAVMPGDPRAQRGNAQRRGIIDPPQFEGGVRGRDRGLRRRRRGLPDFHVNDMAAGRLDPRRRRHHVHHHERRNIASRRRRQQAPGAVSQCRIKHRYLLSELGKTGSKNGPLAPDKPHSAVC